MINNAETVGVVVGRFQAHDLHPGHREILDHVLAQGHNSNLIILGKTLLQVPTRNNPLDVESRMQMLKEHYPSQFTILYLEDVPFDDEEWSNRLDRLVSDFANGRDAVLYGSRDSFAPYYHGKYRISEYQQRLYYSGSELRESLGKQIHGSKPFRHGVIWATQHQYPKVYPTVDVAVFDPTRAFIYLGRKPHEMKLRFIGGFADPVKDKSYEDTAHREVREEANLEMNRLEYIGSSWVDDVRYRGEVDKIITIFYRGFVNVGIPKAGDDIAELHRLKYADVTEEMFVENHRMLYKKLKYHIASCEVKR